jgi:Zn-dependent metalloprotease
MAARKKLRGKLEMSPTYKVPKRIYDIDAPASSKKPRQIAEAFLKKLAPQLKINPDLSQLKFGEVRNSILGKHVLFQQQHLGKPISGAWVRVDVDSKGKVFNVQNDLIPEPALKSKASTRAAAAVAAGPKLSKQQAIEKALTATNSTAAAPHTVFDTEEVIYPKDGVPIPAWKVMLIGTRPKGEWKVYVDQATGAVLDVFNALKEQNGKARVFDPNPVAVLYDTTLKDSSTIPDSAYSDVTLPDLDNSGNLNGPFVSTKNTANRVKSSNFDFRFKRPDRGFKEAMVYFHIDRVQRYIQELGFNNVNNRQVAVNTEGLTDDNSDYSPFTKALRFGTGGVDDAEDAEIILHEYGHSIQDNQVPGFGQTAEGGAMGEGFGDYLAASFFAEHKPDAMKATIGNWDAVAYSGDDPPNLRRLDSNKLYPRDIKGEVHDDGEIWSACLWQIRNALGARTADKLLIAHHFLLTPQSKFEDAAKALITTDGQLNEGRNADTIRDIFIRRGILPNPARGNRRAGVRFHDLHNHGRKH